jgi:hypothetical protein
MQQLSGLDAAFLNLEAPHAPLHIGALAIYDQSSAAGELVTFKGILANIESRLHLARCLSRCRARATGDSCASRSRGSTRARSTSPSRSGRCT